MPDKTFIDSVIAGEASDLDEWIAAIVANEPYAFDDINGDLVEQAPERLGLTWVETINIWYAGPEDTKRIIDAAVARRRAELAAKQQCETCRWLSPTDGGGKIDPEECGVCNDPNLPEWAAEMLADASTGGWAIRRKSDGKTCKHWEAKG